MKSPFYAGNFVGPPYSASAKVFRVSLVFTIANARCRVSYARKDFGNLIGWVDSWRLGY